MNITNSFLLLVLGMTYQAKSGVDTLQWITDLHRGAVNLFGARSAKKITKEGLFDGDKHFIPWDDYYHYPNQLMFWAEMYKPPVPPKQVNGTVTEVPNAEYTPDFRYPEPARIFNRYAAYCQYKESFRYYRIMPKHLAAWMSKRYIEEPQRMNCYCVTVYKKFTPLGMGAVLSYRHILTTAMSTDLVVKRYREKKTLENILGAWYNRDYYDPSAAGRIMNSSYYMTPARITYHPQWAPPENVNRSHPLPCVYDLALWTSTISFFFDVNNWSYLPRWAGYGYGTSLCNRWSNTGLYAEEPMLNKPYQYKWNVVGTQMVMDIGRRPFPWFKYAIRYHGSHLIHPCPKSEWGWFFCVSCAGPHMRLGAEPGAALHVYKWPYDSTSHRENGLAGLNSFAMKLRSKHFVNYFTVLDRHPVLEFLYDAYKSRLPHAYLDARFEAQTDNIITVKEGGQKVAIKYDDPIDYFNLKIEDTWGQYDPIWYK